jgi:hypothetical protein
MIFDLNGRLLYEEVIKPTSENKIDLSYLSKGCYVMVLKNSSLIKKSTLIKD